MGCYKTNMFQFALGLVCSMLLLLGDYAQAQSSVPAFDMEAVTMRGAAPGQSRLDIYTRIPYSHLQFISRSDGFFAEYEVMVEVFKVDDKDRVQGVVLNRIWERKVPPVQHYADTQSDSLYDLTTYTEAELPPGRYIIEVQIEDKTANATFVKKMPLQVRDVSGDVSLSDLLIADYYDPDTRTVLPNVGNLIGNDQSRFVLFYEIYTATQTRARVAYTIYRLKGRSKPSFKSIFRLGRNKTSALDKAEIVLEEGEFLSLRAGRNTATYEIPVESYEVGDYVVRTEIMDEQGRVLDTIEKAVTIRWMGLERQIKNLSEAIAQLEYIAKDRQLRWIKSASSIEEQAMRFHDFWQKRDPTPATIRNERMEEYYWRVAYANREYSKFAKGWQTDRGMVFIQFGEPDYIQRYPYSFGTTRPYEVWTYTGIGRQFIFEDKTGVGDYELLIPIWDRRTRIR